MHLKAIPAATACMAVLLVASVTVAQDAAAVRKLYEQGKYDEILSQASARPEGDVPQDVVYLVGQSQLKLQRRDAAHQTFERLVNDDPDDPWSAIGRSAAAVVEGNFDAALNAVNAAVEKAPDLFYAPYQKGIVLSQRDDFAGAAQAFERALEIDGGFAYAHYYAGMAYYKIKRMDRMATHFQAFVQLAPEAPERPAVETILRSIRGRR